jgi:hypothetical protein
MAIIQLVKETSKLATTWLPSAKSSVLRQSKPKPSGHRDNRIGFEGCSIFRTQRPIFVILPIGHKGQQAIPYYSLSREGGVIWFTLRPRLHGEWALGSWAPARLNVPPRRQRRSIRSGPNHQAEDRGSAICEKMWPGFSMRSARHLDDLRNQADRAGRKVDVLLTHDYIDVATGERVRAEVILIACQRYYDKTTKWERDFVTGKLPLPALTPQRLRTLPDCPTGARCLPVWAEHFARTRALLDTGPSDPAESRAAATGAGSARSDRDRPPRTVRESLMYQSYGERNRPPRHDEITTPKNTTSPRPYRLGHCWASPKHDGPGPGTFLAGRAGRACSGGARAPPGVPPDLAPPELFRWERVGYGGRRRGAG